MIILDRFKHNFYNYYNNYRVNNIIKILEYYNKIFNYGDNYYNKNYEGLLLEDIPYYMNCNDELYYSDYITSGNYGHIFSNNVDLIEYIIKVIPYLIPDDTLNRKNYVNLDINNKSRPENIDYLVPKYISELFNIYNRESHNYDFIVSPHISLPIYVYRCYWQDFIINVPENTLYLSDYAETIKDISPLMSAIAANIAMIASTYINNQIDKLYNDLERYMISPNNTTKSDNYESYKEILYDSLYTKLSHSSLVVYISEYSKNKDLASWFKTYKPNSIEIKILNFQLHYTMACIQTLDPSFRHNDLSYNNILIDSNRVCSQDSDCYDHYIFLNKDYLIPYIGISIRLADFDFSSCNKHPNSKVFYKDINNRVVEPYSNVGIVSTPNLQYDLNYCYKTFANIYNNRYDTHFNRLYNIWCPHMLYEESGKYIEYDYRLRLNKFAQIGDNLSPVLCDIKQTTLPEGWHKVSNEIKRHTYYNMITKQTSNSRPANVNNSIKYSELSAKYLLLHTDLFSDFQCDKHMVEKYIQSDRIINTYKL